MKWLGKHSIFDDLMIGGVLLTPPDPATYSYELTLPNDDGSAGQALTTDGNGLLTWTTIATGSGVTMTNGVDNRVMTATGATAITGEQYFTFDYSSTLGFTTRIIADPTKNVGQALRVEMNGSQTEGVHSLLSTIGGKSGVVASGDNYDIKGFANTIADSATNDANSDSYLWGIVNNLTHSNSTGDTKQTGVRNDLVGATTQYGIQQHLSGGTVGTMFGIWQKVDDGAMDLKFVSSDQTTDDYFSIATGASGATTITTVDGGAAAANLDFVIDGQFSVASTGIDISGAGVISNAEWQGTDVGIAYGGTGQSTAQAAIDALTQVSGASAGEALIKDGSGNATWAAQTNTTYTAGDGLDLSGTTFSTDIKANSGITIDSTELSMDLGASSITGTLAIGDGGTGQTTQQAAIDALTAVSGASAGQRLTKDGSGNATWADATTGTTINGTTANGVGTYGGANTIDIESTLTYNSNVLTIGSTASNTVTVTTPVNAPGQSGDRLYIQCGESGSGTNIAGGQQTFWSGLGTGDKPGGMYTFLGAPAIQLAGGTLRSRENYLFQIFAYTGAANSAVTVLYDVNDIRNYFSTEVKANGETNLTTVDNASHNADLAITADGAVDIISTDASNDITLNSAGEIELNADGGNVDFKNDTAHFAKLENLSNGRGRLELYGGSCGSGNCGSEINLYEDTGAGSNHITLKGAWTSGGLGSDKAINLPNADGTVALTDDSAGGQYWHQIVPGYRQNNTSTTFYYTFYRNWYENWSNGDSSPTSISYTDSFSNFMIAPRAGKITNIKIQGTAADTGATDPFKFYLMKGAMSNGSSSVSLTHMFNTSAITPPAVNQTWSHTEDFTSSNTFAEDDMLFIWLKKDSNSGNQDLFFNININGVYTN